MGIPPLANERSVFIGRIRASSLVLVSGNEHGAPHMARAVFFHFELRSGRNDSRISDTKNSGCSQTAKWPPFGALL
jgi:hypothetical protein